VSAAAAGALAIVTGSSRGMGEALALHLHSLGHTVLGIARKRSVALDAAGVDQWEADLTDAVPVAQRLQERVAQACTAPCAGIWLINNAALLVDAGPTRWVPAAQTVAAVRVGLEAVLLLTHAMLQGAGDFAGDKRVLQVSSGNGRRVIGGMAVYSAIKAGMDHYTRSLALDEVGSPGYVAARVASIAPGIVDTDMQAMLRGSDVSRFAAQAMFAQYHREGALTSPHDAAVRLFNYMMRDDFGQQPVADVRDA
jgi:benzil reductase ((S)-benzoin forming)